MNTDPANRRPIQAVTLGYASIDHFIRVEKFPRLGQKIPFHGYSVMGGGQAATAAVALARWGLSVRCIGRVGGDETGDRAIQWLQDEHVVTDSMIKTPGLTSQTAYIIVPDDCGERTVIWNRQPGLNLRPADLRKEWFDGVSVLFLDGHEIDAAVTAARWVKQQGGKVVLDAEHIGVERDSLLAHTDIAFGSEDFGMREFGVSDPIETIGILRGYGIPLAGVTLGARGSLADWGEGIRRFSAVPVRAIDTTGAGDIYHAALTYGILHGMPWEHLISFASIAASLSCRALGGRAAIPSLEEITEHTVSEDRLEKTNEC
ncbi:carbohydrate kinase family protein [bacterium]|nr:carbohydrate kinase family protein [candidate division CSSED10-310 bacterium]